MKNKTKNKLARNAIRIRKANKERDNEQKKPKKGKRLAVRIATLLGCLLLVSALVLPCFADEMDDGYVPADRSSIWYAYDLGAGDPLYHLLTDNDIDYSYYQEIFQFHLLPVDVPLVDPEMLTIDRLNTESNPYVSNAICYVYDCENNEVRNLSVGSWTTNYYTNGDNRFWFLKFNQYMDDGSTRVALTCRIKFNKDTLIVLESTLESNVYPIGGDFADYEIATVANRAGALPLSYAFNSGFIVQSVRTNFNDFAQAHKNGFGDGYEQGEIDGYEYGHDIGFDSGYSEGFDEGEAAGEVSGYQEGWGVGYQSGITSSNGYSEGYDSGYTDGYNEGSFQVQSQAFQDGYNKGYADGSVSVDEESYQDGYNKAVSEIDSGEFGENFLGNMFKAPIKAVQGITLVQLPDGGSITLGNVFSALIALMLVLAFVKLYSR